jgi:hypothetical protein
MPMNMNAVKTVVMIGLSLAPAFAEIQWDSTYGKDPARRLALALVNSHNDTTSASCMVGGYDPSTPTRVYIGGPCSQLANGKPQAGFRWVVMETVDAEIEGTDGTKADMQADGNGFYYSKDATTHAEVGAAMKIHMKSAAITDAAMFLSTTSYLSKGTFSFSNNSFKIGEAAGNTFKDVCILDCADATNGCDKCTGTARSATPGAYKYSLLAAAYDRSTTSGKGWAKVKQTYGGTDQKLKGFYNVYQAIDFTNMKADTLTVTGPGTPGTATTFASMDPCNMLNGSFKSEADATKACTVYEVSSVTVDSDGHKLSYAFPLKYNVGDFSTTGTGATLQASMKAGAKWHTKNVKIHAVRPSPNTMAAADYKGLTKDSKAIMLRYQFDISGVEAGKFMVYDPTITGSKGSAAAGGVASWGRLASRPTAALFAMMVLAALGIFQ